VADIVLPATQFLEHDDLYQGGGHSHIMWGGKLIEPPGECRSNHEVICDLAQRLGAQHRGFGMTVREIADATLRASGHPGLDRLTAENWIDVQPPADRAHFRDGFAWPDGRFRFRPEWTRVPAANAGPVGPWADMPALPDHWAVTEETDEAHPFKLATSPARQFLNSTFTETEGSRTREGRPTVLIHPGDAVRLGIAEGALVELGNRRGTVRLWARLFGGVQPGVLIAEGIWPNAAHPGGNGINTLIGADPVAPYGGAAFHDCAVWLRAA
jgi:anaerobic selenocysteine-containing dehydrogenase